MSRYSDFYNYPTQSATNLWRANVNRSIFGRRGQQGLRELKEALESLSQKRLISNKVFDGSDVDVIGALAIYEEVKSGTDYSDAAQFLPKTKTKLEDVALIGQEYGLPYIVAWELAYRNDETYANLSPENRYQEILSWVNRVTNGN